MSVPTHLQTKTVASDSAAATTHALTLNNAVRAQGGAICPSTISFAIVYDNGSGGIGTSVTDDIGSTYTRIINQPDASGFTLEVWQAYGVVGGSAPTITWNGSASVKAKLGAVELDQVAPVSPVDGSSTPLDKTTARSDATNSTSRTSAATNTVKRSGQIDVFIGWIGWNDSRTVSAAGTSWTGLVQLSGGSSNLGIAMERKTAEVQNISGVNGIARFTMSGSAGTVPAAVACLAFFRDGVSTDNDQDGAIDDIEGVSAIVTGSTNFVYRSSASAPGGGTGGSEYSQAFAWNKKFYAPAGVIVADPFDRFFSISDGFDDLQHYFEFYKSTFNNNQVGQNLDLSDESKNPSHFFIWLGTIANTPGFHSVTLSRSTDLDPNQPTSADKITEEGDGLGMGTSNYINVAGYAGNIPQYAVFQLTYPALVTTKPRRMTLGAGL